MSPKPPRMISQAILWPGLFIYWVIFGRTGVWTEALVFAKLVLYHLSHASSPFCSGYFEDGAWRTICLSWPQTWILPISASQVIRITGMSHQCPADQNYLVITHTFHPLPQFFFCLTQKLMPILQRQAEYPASSWGAGAA
jgi:hypothetical protein